MKLFIRIKDGQPYEHPIFEDNFIAAFPHVDINNLPPEFARFERVVRPVLNPYEVLVSETPSYELFDGVYKDVWTRRDMDAQEIKAKQDEVKAAWSVNGFASWVFNPETCFFDPPTPHPNDGKSYRWNEETLSWDIQEELNLSTDTISSNESDSTISSSDTISSLNMNGADSITGGV